MHAQEKRYLIGRRDEGEGGMLLLGKYLALDGSTGAPVYLDVMKPHAVLICGKRGYGKSYTMGIIIEEFARMAPALRNNFCAIVIDTMGIFASMADPAESRSLPEWGMGAAGLDINIYAPRAHLSGLPAGARPFEIPTGSLSAYDYCELLGVEPLSEHGAALIGAISSMERFEIAGLINIISRSDAPMPVKSSLCGLLSMAGSWGLFSGTASYEELLVPGSVNVLDLSGYGHDPGIKSCVVASLARALYDIRVSARRREAGSRDSPLIWLFIDEAHMFMDAGSASRAGDVLTNEWLRQGRQPGLSLVLATQRPSALGKDVLSQADVVICHRLTLKDDVEAMEATRPLYVQEPMREALARLGRDRGAAIIVDDSTESCHVIRVRPRMSRHGGGEPIVYDMG